MPRLYACAGNFELFTHWEIFHLALCNTNMYIHFALCWYFSNHLRWNHFQPALIKRSYIWFLTISCGLPHSACDKNLKYSSKYGSFGTRDMLWPKEESQPVTHVHEGGLHCIPNLLSHFGSEACPQHIRECSREKRDREVHSKPKKDALEAFGKKPM